jgi:hypothetical protein
LLGIPGISGYTGAMKTRIAALAALVMAPSLLMAYENSLPNVLTPSALEPVSLELQFEHRFYGSVTNDPLGTAFGLLEGVNAYMGARLAIWRGLEAGLGYATLSRRGSAYLGYTQALGFLRGKLGAELSDFDAPSGVRELGGLFSLALQPTPLGGILVPSVLVCFDTSTLAFGGAIGLLANFAVSFGPVEKVGLTAELYPNLALNPTGLPLETWPAVAFGVMLTTPGHQFTLLLGNSFELGTSSLMRGCPGYGWYLGFNIHRLLQFG